MKNHTNEKMEWEAYCGTLPVMKKERVYGFMDALLVLSGYCIATWSYTQGAYLATLVGFKQLLISAFAGALVMLLIYQLSVILSARYGIDIWIWLRSVFGIRGVKVVSVLIIVINFPWYAVCCDLFASSMQNLTGLFGFSLPAGSHLVLGLLCVAAGTALAYRGIRTITWTTRILVPLLLLVGVAVIIVGFTSVPFSAIWNYQPVLDERQSITSYILSVEANFAFVITLVGGMAEVPRLCRSERAGYYAGVLGQGLAGSFFVVIGAVMAIAMQYVTGKMVEDPTLMMATLSVPALGLTSLLLVAFANIGTQAVGSYLYAVVLKSTFKKLNYHALVLLLGAYVAILCVWGKIVTYFRAFLTLSACVYAPLAALLFVDFFVIRRQKLDMRSAFACEGHTNYTYTRGFNLVGFFCLAAGCALSLAIYNPVSEKIHQPVLFYATPTGCALLGTGVLYWLLCQVPSVRRYIGRDVRFHPDTRPFDRKKVPPRQNLLVMPFLWLYCLLVTRSAHLTIHKSEKRGIRPPFLVLGTHHSFTDFLVTPLALFPHRANYVSELEGFAYYGEWLYRQIGCLGTRKFVEDLALIRNIQKVLQRKGILVLYPEARYANVGTNSELPLSVAKLVKLLAVPVVTLNMKGNYLQSPIWNLKKRREARLHADMTYALTREEVAQLSAEEIHRRLSDLLAYDEYRWQREQNMAITDSKRAEGLNLPLYQCPRCHQKYCMISAGATLSCSNCGTQWEMDAYGTLVRRNRDSNTPVCRDHDSNTPVCRDRDSNTPDYRDRDCNTSACRDPDCDTLVCQDRDCDTLACQDRDHDWGYEEKLFVPDWYEWERQQVREEIKKHAYRLDIQVRVSALPNAKNFIECGTGELHHGEDGFRLIFHDYLTDQEQSLTWKPSSMLSVHTEYDYRGQGQCITLSTQDNTYFLYPLEEGFNATEIQFATEELWHIR